ncbi:YceI family protein [Rhodoferax sp.]|uniref:YceI family protein n=1 Tax=Rhodoferax sp. TaxID=50421 RepID=UPI0025FC013F|nr:YceI family protein [Rhodoferax sp.]
MSNPILRNRFIGLTVALLLGACSSSERIAPRTTVSDAASQARPSDAPKMETRRETFKIAPTESTLHILVYRGGPMARLGHNHVVSSQQLEGEVWRAGGAPDSGFDIRVPVNTLIVDDEAARQAEGADFPPGISDDAKAGTRANMLRPTLLDGERYPQIRIRSVAISGDLAAPQVRAAITLKNQTREVELPVRISDSAGALRVEGAFDIRQSDFGITPLSIAMGALVVVDTITIKFSLLARPGSARQ